jgi:hypothetical protein
VASEYDPGISMDEKIIVFSSSARVDTFGGADLYASVIDEKKGEWQQVVHLTAKFNTVSREFCSYFSSDSKYFFYSSEGDVKWINANAIRQQIENE